MNIDFEEQFHKRDFIQTSLGKIETVDITPERPRITIPILFAPGWRETPELQKECLFEVYSSGRRVITLIHTKKLSIISKQKEYPDVELQKAETLLEILSAKSIEKVDVITHSEGALNVAIAASLKPKQFRNLVLVAPAGLSGTNSIANITVGFIKHITQDGALPLITRKVQIKSHREKINILKNASLALKEGKAIAAYDIHPLLLNLKKKGVRTAVLVGKKDTVFPLKKVKSHLSKLSDDARFGFDVFATKPGGHDLYSKPHEIMQQVERMLEELEAKN